MAYYKPQSPLKKGDDYFYPLTTISQIIKEDNSRLSEDDFGLKMDLLWTNASPTSSFAPQSVSVQTSGYRFFLIVARDDSSDDITTNLYIPNIVGTRSQLFTYSWHGAYVCQRLCTVEASDIKFSDGYKNNSTVTNTLEIPYKIYGIK